jgi:hypothetical protein
MGRYTVLEDPAADAAVQGVLDAIVDEVCAMMGDRLQAILLLGGYGRGEGGVYRDGISYRLVNDLDLLVFVRDYLSGRARARLNQQLEALGRRLTPMASGIKQIDLTVADTLALRFAPNLVVHYEVARGHQVIYGDVDLRKIMTRYDPRKLDPIDGAIYFYSRGSGLLLPALYFATDNLDNPEFQQNFQIEIQKGCQAMGDALLLLARQYHYSYRERLARFKRLDASSFRSMPEGLFNRIAPLYEWATNRKLWPSFVWKGEPAMVQQWFAVRDVLGDFFCWYESVRLGRRFESWMRYSDHIREHGMGEPLDVRIRTIVRSVLKHLPPAGRQTALAMTRRHLLSIMPLLLFGLTSDLSVRPDALSRAATLLGKENGGSGLSEWIRLVQVYLVAFHPGGVVQDIVSQLRS